MGHDSIDYISYELKKTRHPVTKKWTWATWYLLRNGETQILFPGLTPFKFNPLPEVWEQKKKSKG
jgi:hypothetical protein